MKKYLLLALVSLNVILSVSCLNAGDSILPYGEGEVPNNVRDLWKDVDFRKDPLNVEVVKEWTDDGVVCRYVIFDVGTFKGVRARIAAFYTFPKGGTDLPAFVWSHGGGQRSDIERGRYFAKQGFAVVDVNWGGREILENIGENTDWGKVDPSQGPRFYPKALRPSVKLNFFPDDHTIDPVLSPRNGNWYLLAYAGRRAITFLEQQEEVNADQIGFTGYSMGGNITSYAAIDERLKAVIPMVGGTGFITQDFPGIPGSSNARQYPEHAEMFAATMESQSYYQHVQCPVLVLSSSNDFHGIYDRTFPCMDRLPHKNWRTSQKIHDNHDLGPEQWILINKWFDFYLREKGEALPATPPSQLKRYGNGEAVFSVNPEKLDQLESVDIYYSCDPNPRARFWNSVETKQTGSGWTATIPVREGLPLFVFANCAYRLAGEEVAFRGNTDEFTLTSRLQTLLPDSWETERLHEEAEDMFQWENFEKNGLRDWALKQNGGIVSYKFRDPTFKTPPASAKLRLRVEVPREGLSYRVRLGRNQFITGVNERSQSYGANATPGVEDSEIVLSLDDFKAGEETLPDWGNIATILIMIYDGDSRTVLDMSKEENLAVLKGLDWVYE